MPRRLPLLAVVLLLAGCGPRGVARTAASTRPAVGPPQASAATPTPTSATTPPTQTRGPTTDPSLPPEVPTSFSRDVPARRLPLDALIPSQAHPEGSWIADTAAGEAILVAYAVPSGDPFRAERGLVLWRHVGGDPPWEAVLARSAPASAGVLSISVQVADVTGDGAPDALVSEATGGSGSCATWRVIDLARNAWAFSKDLCDGTIQPNLDPVGLMETTAVYRQGDPHCCPSAFRTRILRYRDQGRWDVASTKVTPA